MLTKRKQEGFEQGHEQGVLFLVDVLRDLGHDDREIKKAIMGKYGMSEKDAEKYL